MTGPCKFLNIRCKSVLMGTAAVVLLMVAAHSSAFEQAPAGANAPPQQAAGTELPAPAESTQSAPSETAPTTPPAAEPATTSAAAKRVQSSLMLDDFSYYPSGMVDPFVPFMSPTVQVASVPPDAESLEDAEPMPEPEFQKPLTPLQRMSLAEMERGLKAITWGELGRRALIEDSAGKGYIVSVGTLAGDRNGVITQIFNDHIIVQQEVWDKEQKKMIPLNSIVKLSKEKPKQ